MTNNDYTITISDSTYNTSFIDTSYTTDTGSEHTFNVSNTNSQYTNSLIDPTRVEKMCKEYPALRKAWDNFYSIYKMVDQDYKGNIESKEALF